MVFSLNNYSVYCHISPSGKIYVGISNNPIKRWNNGNGYKKNYLFSRAIKKYGWDNIQHIIIASDLSIDDAIAMERELIESLGLTDPQNGYNLRDGGDGSFSEESIRLMSESRMGNTNCVGRKLSEKSKQAISEKLSQFYSDHPNPFLNKHHSQQTIDALKNRIISDDTKALMSQNHADVSGDKNPSARRVSQYSLSGDFISTFACAKYAADSLSIDLSSIIKCCRGKQKTCGGYVWRYSD